MQQNNLTQAALDDFTRTLQHAAAMTDQAAGEQRQTLAEFGRALTQQTTDFVAYLGGPFRIDLARLNQDLRGEQHG